MLTNLADRVAPESRENLALFPLMYNGMGIGDDVMGKRIEYTKGQMLGDHGIVFIGDVENKKGEQRKALMRCHCGKEFEARIASVKSGITKTCGCTLVKRICKECGNEFFGAPLSFYCVDCHTKICRHCGITFQAKWKKGRGWEKCCSKECADKERKGNPIHGHNKINSYTIVYCNYCFKPTVVRDLARKRERKFCSAACQGAYWAKTGKLRRSNEPKALRQEQRVTPEYKAWHKEVLLRDAYTCRECFDKKRVDTSSALVVHHIVPIYADATKITDVNNGITLCAKCHMKTLTHEAEYAEYYSGLLNLPAPIVNKSLFKTINIPQVLRKIELGYTYKQVAKHFGMCNNTLRTRLDGVTLPPIVYRPKGSTFYTVLNAWIEEGNVRKTAKFIGTTTIKIIEILKLWGVNIKHKKTKENGLTGNIVRRTSHMTATQLAAYFNISRSTICRCRLQYGVC